MKIETESNVLTSIVMMMAIFTLLTAVIIGIYESGKKAGLIESLEDVKVNEFLFGYCFNGVRIEYKGDEYHVVCLKIKQEK